MLPMTTSGSSQISENVIQKIIDEYLKHAPSLMKKFVSGPPVTEENFMFNVFGQQQYLLIAQFDLATLPVKILRRLPVHLIKQFVVQVELDSLWYWALTHDIVESSGGYSVLDQWPLRSGFTTLLSAHFAELGKAPINRTVERLNQIIYAAVPEPVKDLVMNKDMILTYLCYPVLEGIVRFALSPIIDFAGKVTVPFNDGRKSYRPGRSISSLAVLLHALEINAPTLLSKPDLAIDLRDFRLETELLAPPTQIVPPQIKQADGWDSIYQLRNVVLHGTKGGQLRSSLITNLICLIIWHLMDDRTLTQELQRIAGLPRRFLLPRRYYPPEF